VVQYPDIKIEDNLMHRTKNDYKYYFKKINKANETYDPQYDVANVQQDKEYKTHYPISSEDRLLKKTKNNIVLQDKSKSKMDIPNKKNTKKKLIVDDEDLKEKDIDKNSDNIQEDNEEGKEIQKNDDIDNVNDEYSMDNMGDGFDDLMGDQKPQTPEEVGRIYELKKIYRRLLNIEEYLIHKTDPVLIKLKKYVTQSIQLFELLASNIMMYKEKVDDIIISFYKFTLLVYKILKKYYEKEKKGEL